MLWLWGQKYALYSTPSRGKSWNEAIFRDSLLGAFDTLQKALVVMVEGKDSPARIGDLMEVGGAG
jgi:hypothetical protein